MEGQHRGGPLGVWMGVSGQSTFLPWRSAGKARRQVEGGIQQHSLPSAL